MNLADFSANQISGRLPMTTAARQRLQKVFEHAKRCFDKQDFDYANQLFTQCVVEDPCNLIYLQHFLVNLQKKYDDNHKGGRLAALRIKGPRAAFKRAAAKGEWATAIQSACDALTYNPWDIPMLLALADGYQELKSNECELYCLRWALQTDSKNVEVNRQAGLTLERMGQFEQAIICWQRVKNALPEDDESRQAIANLSVEKTIDDGGYDSASLKKDDGEPLEKISVAQLSKSAESVDDRAPEVRLQEMIAANPTTVEPYLELAALYLRQQEIDKAEQLLSQGLHACGSGNLQIRSRIEDLQIRRVAQQLAIAEQRHEQDPSEESEQLVHRCMVLLNQVELETYAARAERDPNNTRLKFELGLRLKRSGKVKDAISTLQAARTDSKRDVIVLLELGECFQHIEQFKLALSHYEQAIEALVEQPESDIYRKSLYRAGVLATGMKEYDRAERHLSALAALDFSYRDVAARLDKMARLRDIE